MGRLKHLSTGREYALTADFTIGRESSYSLPLDSRLVSAPHACVRWNGTTWIVRDLGSRNGTFVDGERIPAGMHAIAAGARLCFGDQQDAFELIDASPPQARARADSGEECIAEDGLLSLPGPEQPEITIFVTEMGTWLAELDDGARVPVIPGTRLEAGGQVWHIDVPRAIEPTHKANQFSTDVLSLRFHESLDQKTVSVDVTHRGQTQTLPHRAHMYLVLALARARLEDRTRGDLPESEHGWRYIPDLMDMFVLHDTHFNVILFRARKQFAKAGMPGATMLFERRQATHEIRIGVGDLEVVRGEPAAS